MVSATEPPVDDPLWLAKPAPPIIPVHASVNDPDVRARLEWLGRTTAKASPLGLALYHTRQSDTPFYSNRFLRYVNKKIMAAVARPGGRLMIFAPPRHGKSELASHYTPPWYLGNYPSHRATIVSYAAEFARQWGGLTRDVFTELGPALWGMTVRGQGGTQRWNVAGHSGLMRSVGWGGPLTGMGINLGLLDDPIKGDEQAHSELQRANLFRWWQSTFLTRMEPNASVILLMTRWHESDLAGMILEEDRENRWEVISVPAICEEPDDPLGREIGEALWPERYDEDALSEIRSDIGEYVWGALYQQRPAPLTDGIFDITKIARITRDKVPSSVRRWHRYWDLAISEKESASFTASVRVGVDHENNVYVTDGYAQHIDGPKQFRLIKTVSRVEAADTTVYIESALHGTFVWQQLIRDPDMRGIALQPVRVDKDKVTRALVIAGLNQASKLYVVDGPWVREFFSQLSAFTAEMSQRHDDYVDALSGGHTAAVRLRGASVW